MRQKDKFPHLHSKPINYNQDGTGRDSYIMIGNGGLQKGWAGKEYRNAFKDSLRGYSKNQYYLQNRNYNTMKSQSPDRKQDMNGSIVDQAASMANRALNSTMYQHEFQSPMMSKEKAAKTIELHNPEEATDPMF